MSDLDAMRERFSPDPGALWVVPTEPTVTTIPTVPLCPDLLRYGQLGEADGWRGRVVRGFFRLLRVVTGV